MKYTEEEKKFLEKKRTENLIETYQEELLRIVRGENCFALLPRSVRRRLRRYGIIKKFGHKYEVTPLGREMLKEGLNA